MDKEHKEATNPVQTNEIKELIA